MRSGRRNLMERRKIVEVTSAPVLIFFWLILGVGLSHAESYAEYRNDLKFENSSFGSGINYLRLGYRFNNNVYFDIGPRTDGISAEVGYKYEFLNDWVIKGKWEGSEVDDLRHKLETELRYSVSKLGGTYLEYKSEAKFRNSNHTSSVDHLRVGYQFDNNFYFEAGPRTDGASGEIGYKYRFSDKWSFKGKWEGHDTDRLTHKIECELRYRF